MKKDMKKDNELWNEFVARRNRLTASDYIIHLCLTAIIVWCLVVLSGCIAGAQVLVHNDVEASPDDVKQEVYHALDFIGELENFDKQTWEHQLSIEVFGEDLGSCGEHCIFTGQYWHSVNLLYVWWFSNTCKNAFIHELAHRVSWLRGFQNGMFGGTDHGPAYQENYQRMMDAWRLESNCDERADLDKSLPVQPFQSVQKTVGGEIHCPYARPTR
jgi:hypothetical protein